MTGIEWFLSVAFVVLITLELVNAYQNRRLAKESDRLIKTSREFRAEAERRFAEADAEVARATAETRWVVDVANEILERNGIGKIGLTAYTSRGSIDDIIDEGGHDGA